MKILWLLAVVAVTTCCALYSIKTKKKTTTRLDNVINNDTIKVVKDTALSADDIIEYHFVALGGKKLIKSIKKGFERHVIKDQGHISHESKWFVSGVKSVTYDTTGTVTRKLFFTRAAGISITEGLPGTSRQVNPSQIGNHPVYPHHIFGKNYYSWPDLLIDYKKKGYNVKRVDNPSSPYYAIDVTLPKEQDILLIFDPETFLVVRTVSPVFGLKGFLEITDYSDFKTRNGYTYSGKQESDVGYSDSTFIIDTSYHYSVVSVSYDINIEDSIFIPPWQVIELYNRNNKAQQFNVRDLQIKN
ncbi:hypothetical protein HGH93_21755 [Chitinophaga polysaccharea]|uniref:hypothetical protein n=1 Tax=Chitinophaga polysaccharea TaxID=1293035 RepID=UPI0014558BAA|nr:hypothetical protein [Chitinophaga polysaccharea]NLR60751.1 hypothetical protein [Chitinophaga polysaccharea]